LGNEKPATELTRTIAPRKGIKTGCVGAPESMGRRRCRVPGGERTGLWCSKKEWEGKNRSVERFQ